MNTKNYIVVLFLLFGNVFAQKPVYFARNSMYRDPENSRLVIKKETLNSAILMRDIIQNYPTQWNDLIDYVSVEIFASHEGVYLSSKNTNDTLTQEQKNILSTADLGAEIEIVTTFKYKDPSKDGVGSGRKIKEMGFSITLVPEIEAEYPGGNQQMRTYIKETVIDKMGGIEAALKTPGAEVLFVVNEQGEITSAKIIKASTDPKVNKLVLEAIYKMPKWKPAENATGTKVKQEFKLSAPLHGC